MKPDRVRIGNENLSLVRLEDRENHVLLPAVQHWITTEEFRGLEDEHAYWESSWLNIVRHDLMEPGLNAISLPAQKHAESLALLGRVVTFFHDSVDTFKQDSFFVPTDIPVDSRMRINAQIATLESMQRQFERGIQSWT
jgi:hypothetical protein